jgi:hypothetical protein
MRTHRSLAITKMFLLALVMTLLFVGRIRAQGAADSAYLGKFTLAKQIHWGKSVLRPGHYTIAIASSSSPVIVKVQNENTGESFRVVTAVHEEKTTGSNALLLQVKNGQPTVHSLSLPEIGMVLIYEPASRREPVVEAHASQVVPVLVAKK